MPKCGPWPTRPLSQPAGEAITAAGLTALKSELEELETEGRQAIGERLLAARSLGDLKENAEYHIAKDDQAHLETKIKRLRMRLRDAVVVDSSEIRRSPSAGRPRCSRRTAATCTPGRSSARPRPTSPGQAVRRSRPSPARCSAGRQVRSSRSRLHAERGSTGSRSCVPLIADRAHRSPTTTCSSPSHSGDCGRSMKRCSSSSSSAAAAWPASVE